MMARDRRHAKGWIVHRGVLTRGSVEKDRRTTALHEAAHAVVAHRLGEKVTRLWINQRGREGRCRTHGFTEIVYLRRGRKLNPFSRMIVCLAGHEAEHMVYGRPHSLLPRGDLRDIYALGMTTDQSLNLAGWLTRRYVRWHLPAMRRVAKELGARGKLDRRGFLRALRASA